MENSNNTTEYVQKLVIVAAQLPEDRAAQLYAFARFLFAESRHSVDDITEDDASDTKRAAENAQWDAALTRHADTFAALKAQALVDVSTGKTSHMFNEHGDLVLNEFTRYALIYQSISCLANRYTAASTTGISGMARESCYTILQAGWR